MQILREIQSNSVHCKNYIVKIQRPSIYLLTNEDFWKRTKTFKILLVYTPAPSSDRIKLYRNIVFREIFAYVIQNRTKTKKKKTGLPC